MELDRDVEPDAEDLDAGLELLVAPGLVIGDKDATRGEEFLTVVNLVENFLDLGHGLLSLRNSLRTPNVKTITDHISLFLLRFLSLGHSRPTSSVHCVLRQSVLSIILINLFVVRF